MENMDKGLIVPKWVLINWTKITQMLLWATVDYGRVYKHQILQEYEKNSFQNKTMPPFSLCTKLLVLSYQLDSLHNWLTTGHNFQNCIDIIMQVIQFRF